MTMRRVLKVKAGTTAEEIKQRTGATLVELRFGGTVAIVDVPHTQEGNMLVAKKSLSEQVDDPASPILSAEDDPEVSCDTSGDWYREGFGDGLAAVEGFARAMRESREGVAQADLFADTDEWTWGLQAIGADQLPREHGAGVKVAVLDTGLATGHPDWKNRKTIGRNFADPNAAAFDGYGHGTHVAGTVCGNHVDGDSGREYGIATNAQLYVAKVLADNGTGRMSWVLQGIEWAIEQGCSVVNMSLGGPKTRYAYLEAVGEYAMQRGCLLVASAGNEGRSGGQVRAPANATWVVGVGALDRSLRPAAYSNTSGPDRASAVDISAPGSGVWSSWKDGGYATLSGTSMASPHAAGCACLWMERFASQGMPEILRAAMTWRQLVATARVLPEQAATVGAGCVQVPR